MRADLTTRAALAYLVLAAVVVGGFIVLAAEIQAVRGQQRSDATAAATLTASGALDNSLLSLASGTAGSGLGLAISKAIAEAHGGSLRIVDSPGPGTTFLLAVPVTVPVTGPVTGPAGARL
jgi:hypothetical protein